MKRIILFLLASLLLLSSPCYSDGENDKAYEQRQKLTEKLWYEGYKHFGAKFRLAAISQECGDNELFMSLLPKSQEVTEYLLDYLINSVPREEALFLNTGKVDEMFHFLNSIDWSLRTYGMGYGEATKTYIKTNPGSCKSALLEGYRLLNKK